MGKKTVSAGKKITICIIAAVAVISVAVAVKKISGRAKASASLYTVKTEIYENVRRKTETNKYGTRSVEVVYLLRNKIKCGYCGSPISAECGTAKNGQKIRYYKCLGRKHQSGCKKSQVRKEIL